MSCLFKDQRYGFKVQGNNESRNKSEMVAIIEKYNRNTVFNYITSSTQR